MFNSVRHTNVVYQIIDQIRNSILTGKLRPGDKLPSEKDLIKSFQVSMPTLREALRTLEYLRLIEMRKGVNGGIFIAEVDMQITLSNLTNFLHFKNVSIEHISSIRELVEPYCAKIAAEKISEKDLGELRRCIDKCKELKSEIYSAEVTRHEIQFHRVITRQTENPILILIVDYIENLLEDLKHKIRPGQQFTEFVIDSHERIYNAIKDRDPERAYEEMLKDVSEIGNDIHKMMHSEEYFSLTGA